MFDNIINKIKYINDENRSITMPVTLPIIKIELESEYFETVDVTSFINNLRDIDVKMQRSGLSGVSVSVSTPIEFVREAKDLIYSLFKEYELYSKANVNIYKRDNNSNNYNALISFGLDFQSYENNGTVISLSAIEDSLQEYIKSGKNNNFDILVSEVADSLVLEYNSLNLPAKISYTVAETEYKYIYKYIGDVWETRITPSITLNTYDVNPESINRIEAGSSTFNIYAKPEKLPLGAVTLSKDAGNNYLIMGTKDNTPIKLSVKMRFIDANNNPFVVDRVVFYRLIPNTDTNGGIIDYNGSPIISLNNITDIDISESEILINENERIIIMILVYNREGGTNPLDTRSFFIKDASYMYFKYIPVSSPIIINVIDPSKLLQKYIDLIAGYGKFTSEIEWDEEFIPMLCAGETIRNFPTPYLHDKLGNFMEWMEVMGYTYQYIGNKIVYKKRDLFYKSNIISMSLEDNEVSNVVEKSEGDFAYTSLNIGYKKQDYRKNNGLLDPNGTFNYLTGYTNQKENILSIISPYRADPLGFEYLTWERYSVPTDTDNASDKDIFALQLRRVINDIGINYYAVDNNYIITSSGIELFNGALNPYFLVQRNKSKIGINTKHLRFTATDGYRESLLDGNNILYQDIDISDRLFKPIKLSFNAGTYKSIPNIDIGNGIIQFYNKGELKKGFIETIKKSYVNEKEVEWTLYEI